MTDRLPILFSMATQTTRPTTLQRGLARERLEGEGRIVIDRWDGAEPPTALELEQRLRAEGLRPCRFVDPPGKVYPPHRHQAREVRWLLCGKLRIRFEGDEGTVVLGPGDRIDLPAGLLHAVEVFGDDPAVFVAAAGVARQGCPGRAAPALKIPLFAMGKSAPFDG